MVQHGRNLGFKRLYLQLRSETEVALSGVTPHFR